MSRAPDIAFNFEHTVKLTAPVPAAVQIWNLIDFSHVNWVHGSRYEYCRILGQSGHATLLEYGIKRFFVLGFGRAKPTLMWHEYLPPRSIRHLSANPWGGYTRVEATVEEFEQDGKAHSTATHVYSSWLPWYLRPLRPLLKRYIDSWAQGLWKDDYPMLVRRHRVLELGFKGVPVDLAVRAEEGFAPSRRYPLPVT